MPIVISYEDVEALGSLAYGAGSAQGAGQAAQQNRAIGAQQTAQAMQMRQRRDELEMASRQADIDRSIDEQRYQDEQEFRGASLQAQQQQDDARIAAQLQEAGMRREGTIASQILKSGAQTRRDETLHGFRMEEIGERARTRPTAAPVGTLSEDGTPDVKFAQQESQRFGHLIPYTTTGSASSIARNQKDIQQRAQQIAQLPTAKLREFIQEKPDGGWTPYIRGLVQSREGLVGRRGAAPVGAMPEGRMPSAGRGFGGGDGYNDPQASYLSGLPDDQLFELVNNPGLLNQ